MLEFMLDAKNAKAFDNLFGITDNGRENQDQLFVNFKQVNGLILSRNNVFFKILEDR